jgi:hypothetical protein
MSYSPDIFNGYRNRFFDVRIIIKLLFLYDFSWCGGWWLSGWIGGATLLSEYDDSRYCYAESY